MMRSFVALTLVLVACGRLDASKADAPDSDDPAVTQPGPTGETATDKTVVVKSSDQEFVVISLGSLDLSVPAQLKPSMKISRTDTTENAGTVEEFEIEYTAIENGGFVKKRARADLQAGLGKCEPDQRLQAIRTQWGEADGGPSPRFAVIKEIENEAFQGWALRLEDHRHGDRNFIRGAIDKKNGRCWSISLAVYGLAQMNPTAARQVAKPIMDRIASSIAAMTGDSQGI